MKIFEDTKQIGNRLAEQAESQYEYLRDSGGSTAILIRNIMEQWFKVYCLEVSDIRKINDLRARLQSKDDLQFLGAFTELYAFILLKKFNHEITAEEMVENGKKPDFLSKTSKGKKLYVEVTTFSEGDLNVKRTKAYKLIADKINKKVKSTNYAISLDWNGQPIENDINPTILNEIQKWIDNPNSLIFVKNFSSWSLTLSAIYIQNSKRSNKDGIVAFISNSKIQCYSKKGFQPDAIVENIGDFLGGMKKALTEKAKKYGELGKPYILVLNILSNNIAESMVEDAVLNETITNKNRTSPSFFSEHPNVNGVLAFFNLDPWNMMEGNIPRKESLYFINPDAKEGFDHRDFRSLFKNEPYTTKLDRTKLSAHLDLPQEEYHNALNSEDPVQKHKKAIDWMQDWLCNNMN